MDCCNYVQPYSGTGHFYQQHNFCYDNMNAYSANYGMAPVTNAMEANVRYNRLPPAYPTDYVYNPKEARLRKAMREQSRELSRQSILQTAIASATGTASGTNTGPTPANFLHHPLTCASSAAAAVSSLPSSPSINPARIINPWFPVGHAAPTAHLKPILSPRIMAAHQRTLEKTKEAIRKQVECATAGIFSAGSAAGYAGDFAAAHGTSRVGTGPGPGPGPGANEYCIIAEFSDGQKWHPYQNGTNPYHGRGAAMSKIGGLHPNVQNTNAHGPWSQFCGLPLPTSATQNPVIRAPRHMVFLQEQQSQHCTFGDEMQLSLSYVPNKVEVNPRLQVAYPQADHQGKAAVSPSQMQQLQDDDKCAEGVPRWDSTVSTPGPETVAAVQRGLGQDQDHEVVQGDTESDRERDDVKQKASCKQPLPGFHQAFGSTEIGRFSRSEFFANMVGESNNVIPEAYLPAPVFPFSPTSQGVLGNPTMPPAGSADEDLLQQIMPEDCYWLGVGGGGGGGGQSHQSNAQTGMDNATNYAAFLDYSHRLGQEWLLHPAAATPQELQAAFIEQPGCLFHEGNCSSLLGHDQQYLAYSTSANPCPSFDHNRSTPTSIQNMINDHGSLNYLQVPGQGALDGQIAPRGGCGDGGPDHPIVIKQNDRICVMLESNQIQMEKDIM